MYYHVTDRTCAEAILTDGFEGGWGDAGFGIYLFGNPRSAQCYANKGGWDGQLDDPVILVVLTEDVEMVVPDPAWPNPEDYYDVYWHPMDEDENIPWAPEMRLFDFSLNVADTKDEEPASHRDDSPSFDM